MKIPLSADFDGFKKGMSDTGQHAGRVVKGIADNFDKLNTGMVAGAGAAARNVILKYATIAVGVVGSFKAISAAISATREQLAEMVAIADKASKLNVSPAFLQAWQAEAQKLKVTAGELESALSAAFQATKEKGPIDLEKWSVGKERITDVEKMLRVFNATLAKTAGTKLEGLVMFRDAENQETKIFAVLTAMKELDKIGQKVAALELGDKMFGSAFVDNIRTGKTSVDSIFETMKRASEAGSGLFTSAAVERAKEIDLALQRASDKLSRELRPSWDGLAQQLLSVKQLWADIVSLIGDAVRAINQFEISGKRSTLSSINRAIESGESLVPGIPRVPESVRSAMGATTTLDEDLRARRDRLQKEIDDLEAAGRTRITVNPNSRGVGAVPTKDSDKDTSSSRDRFDTAADTIEKRTAKLQAEAATIDLGTEARERAKIAAELEAIAIQMNSAAGKENSAITAEQRERIDAVAAAYGRAAKKIEDARSPLQTFMRESQDINARLNQFGATSLGTMADGLTDIQMRTKSASAAFKSMADSMIRDLLRIANRAALSGIMGMLGVGGGGSVGANPGSVFDLMAPSAFQFHKGGVAGSGGERRAVDPSWFDNAPRYHGGGIAGLKPDEVPAILRKGEPVFRDMAHARQVVGGASGGGVVSVTGGNTTITVQGNADQGVVNMLRAELDKRDREFSGKVIQAWSEARARRMI